MLWKLVGVAVLGGVAVMVVFTSLILFTFPSHLQQILVIPLNTVMARKQGAIQKRMLVNKDQRIKTTSEVLNGIRVIKFFAWEGISQFLFPIFFSTLNL